MLRQRMTTDLPSRRVSERVEPWMTPVAPINWTQVSMVDTVPFHSPHLLTYLARAFSARWNCFSASSLPALPELPDRSWNPRCPS